MNKQMTNALSQGDQTPVVLVGSKEVDLVDNRELRNSLVENEAVFDDSRVKALAGFLLPKDFGATTEQVANYFEVGTDAIESVVRRNRNELVDNGFKYYSRAEIQNCQIDGLENIPNRGMNIFSRRAILNVAMLLRDSQVAKTIRSVLLDATENKTVVKEIINQQQFDMSQLSPSLQAFGQLFQSMAQVELNQKQMEQEIKDTKEDVKAVSEKVEAIKEVVALDTTSWREETTNLINKIATYRGGTHNIYQETRREAYELLDKRFGVNLEQRLTNKRRRMADEGICKSKRDKLSKLDVIADDKKLTEGYVIVVKAMAIKYGVV